MELTCSSSLLMTYLQSIVTNYAGLILEDSVKILENFSPGDKSSMELWRRVTLTLSKTFEHDQDSKLLLA